MKKEIKEITLRTLRRRKDVLTHKGNFNVQFLRENIQKLKQELETRESHHTVGSGIGVQVEVYPETHTKIIKQQEERLERSLKEIEELEQAIEYIEGL
jgi:DNA-binding protein YbaB